MDAQPRTLNPAQQAGFFSLAPFARPRLRGVALQSYRRERVTELAIPAASVLVEGGVIGVIAEKLYGASPLTLALITAIPMAANLSSFVWARLAQGRRKIPLLVGLQGMLVAGILAISFLPTDDHGLAALVGIMLLCRLWITGSITLRSLVWTLNYPDASRARITSRLALTAACIGGLATVVAGKLLDGDPTRFHAIYLAGALIGVVGVIATSGIRLRREHHHLKRERADARRTDTGSTPSLGLLGVLRADPHYARYQGSQFLLGVSNMMTVAPVIYLVSSELQASYTVSLVLIMALPVSLGALSLPLWAQFLDRAHVIRFRSRFTWLFCLAQLLTWWGALAHSVPILALARLVLGIGQGGGSLAWQIGHNHFVGQERAGLYMGLHVSLTGLRGLVAPFLGMLLFTGWSSHELMGLQLPGFAGLGAHVLAVCAALTALSWLSFRRLETSMGERARSPRAPAVNSPG